MEFDARGADPDHAECEKFGYGPGEARRVAGAEAAGNTHGGNLGIGQDQFERAALVDRLGGSGQRCVIELDEFGLTIAPGEASDNVALSGLRDKLLAGLEHRRLRAALNTNATFVQGYSNATLRERNLEPSAYVDDRAIERGNSEGSRPVVRNRERDGAAIERDLPPVRSEYDAGPGVGREHHLRTVGKGNKPWTSGGRGKDLLNVTRLSLGSDLCRVRGGSPTDLDGSGYHNHQRC